MKKNIGSLCKILLFAVLLSSCSRPAQHTQAEIEQAMNNYDSLILKQDAAAIAQAFTPGGKLGDAATDRAAIQNMLMQVKGFKVIEQSSTTINIQIRGDSALHRGTYIQRDVDTKNDTLKAQGTFVCKWKWTAEEGWKIDHIVTRPF